MTATTTPTGLQCAVSLQTYGNRLGNVGGTVLTRHSQAIRKRDHG